MAAMRTIFKPIIVLLILLLSCALTNEIAAEKVNQGKVIKLKINKPDNVWKKVAGDPYRGSWEWAINHFALPEKVKEEVKAKIGKNQFNWWILRSGQELEQITFGQNKIWSKVDCQWEKTQLYAAKEYKVNDYHIIKVLKCGNWGWFKTEKVKKEEIITITEIERKKEEKIIVPGIPKIPETPETPRTPIHFPGESSQEKEGLAKFDFYIGAGTYSSVHSSASGDYLWSKLRYRPFQFEFDNFDLGLGLFSFGNMSSGHDGDYYYWSKRFAFGPTAKLVGHHWDADLDLGWGKLYNQGKIDLYRSKQIDKIYLLSGCLNLYSRQDEGKRWFPKSQFGFEANLPYQSHHKHSWDGQKLESDPYNNKVVEFYVKQSIYDFKPSKYLRITPEFNLGFIHEYGEGESFLRFGPSVTLHYQNEDILSLSFLNYKKELGGNNDQWHLISGWLDIGSVYQAYKARQIRQIDNKDLI
jgi:hypothetical protein